jgi:hypothetical protein
MPKQKYWTNERLYRGLLGIAQLDELPSQLSKPDAQRPPEAYLGAAVAAIGEGSTPSGLVQQLTHEPDLRNAVVGGFEPLLQKMADLVEHLPIVVHPATSQPLAFFFFFFSERRKLHYDVIQIPLISLLGLAFGHTCLHVSLLDLHTSLMSITSRRTAAANLWSTASGSPAPATEDTA